MAIYIQTSPSPRFRELLVSGKSLGAASDVLGNNSGREIRWFSSGSQAIKEAAVLAAGKAEGQICFFPEYFCDSALKHLRTLNAKIVFYKLKYDLTPDWDDVLLRVRIDSPDLFVLVHTFGWIQPLVEALHFARDHNCTILEDAAHVLDASWVLADRETLVLFTPYKVIGIPQVAYLSMPGGNLKLQVPDNSVKYTGSDFVWAFKRAIQKGISSFRRLGMKAGSKKLNFSDDLSANANVTDTYLISKLAVDLMPSARKVVLNYSLARRLNYSYLSPELGAYVATGLPFPFLELPPFDVAPYCFPLFVDELDAPAIFKDLWSMGIPVSSWPDLPANVSEDNTTYPVSAEWRKRLLLFPLHQSLSELQLKKIKRGVNYALQFNGKRPGFDADI